MSTSYGFDVLYLPDTTGGVIPPGGGFIRPLRSERGFEILGLHPLCVQAVNSYNRDHNTKYEFLEIKKANMQYSGCGGYTFYITFRARQNAATETFQTLVYKDFLTKDKIEFPLIRLKANA